jgi:hypothetical protein
MASPRKNLRTRNTDTNDTDNIDYPNLQDNSALLDQGEASADRLFTLQANFEALQQAQVKQGVEAQQTQTTLRGIEKLLAQLLARDESRGRSRSRSHSQLPARQPSQERHASPNLHDRFSPTSQESYGKKKRTAKVPDPQKLTDGKNPTFASWEIQVWKKLEVNADHFDSETARMYYVYSCTEGDAQKHLYPRYQPRAADPFLNAQDMVQHLSMIFSNPNRVREARYEYQQLEMGKSQPFYEFKTQFLHLADEAQIPQTDRFDDLYDKLSLSLQAQLVSHRHSLQKNFNSLCALANETDTDLKRLAERKAKEYPLRVRTVNFSNKAQSDPPPRTSPASTPFVRTVFETREKTPVTEPPRLTPPQPTSLTCFNCGKPDHIARECTEPKRKLELKDIEEGSSGNESA